ncbi:AAA family ATPase [Actinopolymorpha sp. NPDC004070]|uniref:AAA family ATPase n=1 Tax=Actinopolymorpha sp. NPDC004070 TaxID=3154548 RepID=UPI0033B128FA
MSQTLFVDGDLRRGLREDAATLLGAMLPAQARPSRQSLAVLILRDHQFDVGADWPDAEALLLVSLGLDDSALTAITSDSPIGAPLLTQTEWSFETIDEALRPEEAVVVQAPATSVPSPDTSQMNLASAESDTLSVIVDSRVERMLRLALTSYSSVLLVGPPGTGKGMLLRWALAEVEADPERYGFDRGRVPNAMWRTPDESWTSFELIGGLAPDEGGALKWSPGALLDAISENRWLILDEANRGDMDKIMGPLLTWLSKQEVEIGRSHAHGGHPIHIGWSSDRNSIRTSPTETANVARYLAGRDWRLLGTYNPQDAQRVFRFGQALSRRFVTIPVPAVKPGQFSQLLERTYPHFSADAVAAVVSLYTAHLAEEATVLGPALFLGIARYVLAGFATADYSEGSGPVSPSAVDVDLEDPAGDRSELLGDLLAEAYILGAGRYLAGYDDRLFEALGEIIVNDEGALSRGQWIWVKAQRDVLS